MEAQVGKLTATVRKGTGKTVTRKLRKQGLIPAVLYGGKSDSVPLTLSPDELRGALDPAKKQNTMIELTLDDGSSKSVETVMLKDYQHDVLRGDLTHVDLVRTGRDQTVRAHVHFGVTGRAVGVQMGGKLNQVFRKLEVECTPDRIPASIVVDVSALNLGQALTISQLELPEGVKAVLPADQTVVLIQAPRGGTAATAATEEETPAEG